MKIMKTPVEKAAQDLQEQRAKLARWEREKATARAELETLQGRAGVEALDDETGTAATRLARAMTELRDRIDIAGRAIAAQGPRVEAAEAAYLNAEADELEAPVAKARAALTRHEAKTKALLAELEEHEGVFVSEVQALDMMPSGANRHGMTFKNPKSWALKAAVEAAERPVNILRALAEGRQPLVRLNTVETPAEVYPACVWGPEALVKAPAYLRHVEVEQARQAAAGEAAGDAATA